ncbi:MAG TPA: hypothetical protein VG501_09740, partial [Rhizomicrobium sp.]|nr:hypothetical protein [Rhizomicrobium sp.]
MQKRIWPIRKVQHILRSGTGFEPGRRHFLAGMGAAFLSGSVSPALAALGEVRSLAFDNLHTGE